jgi:hypothetical protein
VAIQTVLISIKINAAKLCCDVPASSVVVFRLGSSLILPCINSRTTGLPICHCAGSRLAELDAEATSIALVHAKYYFAIFIFLLDLNSNFNFQRLGSDWEIARRSLQMSWLSSGPVVSTNSISSSTQSSSCVLVSAEVPRNDAKQNCRTMCRKRSALDDNHSSGISFRELVQRF